MDFENTNSFFLKLDTENGAHLIEDLDLEKIDLLSSLSPLETASIDGMLLKSFKSILHIPTYQDLVKIDIEMAKTLSKLLNVDKNTNINNIINKLLSIDFREQFIFSEKNLSIICNILIYAIGELKKFKVTTYMELEAKIKSINFSKYDFIASYLKKDCFDKKNQNFHISREQKINSVLLSKISIKEIDEEWTEIDEKKINFENKNYSKRKGYSYIDNYYENFMFSSLLNKDHNYDEEEIYNKLVTYNCFNFQKSNKDYNGLPLELIILLYKLKDIKAIIFQINKANEHFIKMALFVLMNINWLFMHKIEELKLDLNDAELHKQLYIEFSKRASELYEDYKVSKPLYYFPGHNSRKYNFWETEGDLMFEKVAFNKKNDLIFSEQYDLIENTFDNTLCNIYNENGFITNFKYIRPIINTINDLNNDNEFIKVQGFSDSIDSNASLLYYRTNSINTVKSEKSHISNFINTFNARRSNPAIFLKDKIESQSEKTTTEFIKDFVKNNISSFHLMSLYFYFLPCFQNLKKFGIYFDFSFSLEIKHIFSLVNSIYERFHFLIFANSLNSLNEANFSFNSLDSDAFENILGIIKKNKNLNSLKMSFFSQEINYSENNLFYLCSQKKQSLNKLFMGQNELLIKANVDMERNLSYYILHHNKIIDNFVTNFKNLFNLLKFESLNTLEEIILRFDIPNPILNSEKYINILVKFIINIFIALSLQKNKIKNFKILAPMLPFDANKMPLIKQFFEELGEVINNDENNSNTGNIKDKISILDNNIGKRKSELNNNLYYDSSVARNNNFSGEDGIILNTTLEEITLNLKFYNLPEIFNIIQINNLPNLKKINIGSLDEITFISFLSQFKNNSENFKNLTSLKIGLCNSLISYTNISTYIKEYINIDTPILDEKYLFSNLKIKTDEEINELINIVYYMAKTPKLVVQIANDNTNLQLLSKATKRLTNDRDGMYCLRMIMEFPKYQKIMASDIINCLSGFYGKKENRMIICKENPNEINKDKK